MSIRYVIVLEHLMKKGKALNIRENVVLQE